MMESRTGDTKEEDHVVRRLVRLTTWTQEQWDPHLDLSAWWNKLPTTIPYSTLSTDVTSKASLFPLSSLLSPSKYSFVPLFLFLLPSQPLSAFLSMSLGVISIWHTVNQGVSSSPLSDLSSSPTAPVCSGLSIREPLPGQMPLTQLASAIAQWWNATNTIKRQKASIKRCLM